LLLAQLGLLFYFGERSHLLPRAVRSRTSLYLAVDPLATKQLGDLAEGDPALLALPSLNGFSANGWMKFRGPDYRPEKWTEPPVYLSMDTSQLGKLPMEEEANDTLWPLSANRILPETVEPIPVPPLPLSSSSSVHVEEVQNRRLSLMHDLPGWQNDELLTNTVVQVLIDPSGNTISARLLKSSGLKAADDYGLKAAAGARFEPDSRFSTSDAARGYTFGRLIFQWQTIAATITNSISSLR
jgi:TonB family protein